MISREFIYEFSNFDDISARENDKKTRPHDIFANFDGVRHTEMGIRYNFNRVTNKVVIFCAL